MTTMELLRGMAQGQFKFRPFTANDWSCFAGCEGANPIVHHGDRYTIVVDDTGLEVFDNENDCECILHIGNKSMTRWDAENVR